MVIICMLSTPPKNTHAIDLSSQNPPLPYGRRYTVCFHCLLNKWRYKYTSVKVMEVILHSLHNRCIEIKSMYGLVLFKKTTINSDTQHQQTNTSHRHMTNNTFYRHTGNEWMRGNRFWQCPVTAADLDLSPCHLSGLLLVRVHLSD